MRDHKREDDIIVDITEAMKFKFAVHQNKGNWKHKPISQLYNELNREVLELQDSLSTPHKKEAILSECADIANYVAMIWDIIKDMPAKEKSEHQITKGDLK